MAQHQRYKVAARVSDVRYEDNGTTVDLPGVTIARTAVNNSDVDQNDVVKFSKERTNSFTWTLKETISTGIPLSAKVYAPPVCFTTNLSTDICFDSPQTKTESEIKLWEANSETVVPPHSKIEKAWTINEKESSGTFYADIILTGYFAIWNKDKVDINSPGGSDKRHLWFVPIDEAFNQMKDFGVSVPPLYTIGSGSVTYKASGECKGVSGFNTCYSVTAKDCRDAQSKESIPSDD